MDLPRKEDRSVSFGRHARGNETSVKSPGPGMRRTGSGFRGIFRQEWQSFTHDPVCFDIQLGPLLAPISRGWKPPLLAGLLVEQA